MKSLATALSQFVPAKIRKRGAEYFHNGLVNLVSCNGEKVEAVVSGTEGYQVVLRRDDTLVWAGCSCPYSNDRGEVCKHIWATVLAADEDGGLRGPRGGLPDEIISDAFSLDDDWDDDGIEAASPRVPSKAKAPAPPPAPRPPAWREILAPLTGASSVPAVREEEILYVIDLPESVKRQGLSLEVLTFRRKQDGSRGALRPKRINRGQIEQRPDPLDRAILHLLLGASWSSWYYIQELTQRPWVPDEMAQEVVRRLCATGRCHLRWQAQQFDEEPVNWHDGPPWELWLVAREGEDGGCEIIPELRNDSRRLDARELTLLDKAGLWFTLERVVPVDTGGGAAWLPLLRRAGSLRVPAAEREDFLEMLLAAPVLPRLD